MATNMWVEQEWSDYKLRWDPEEYGGVKTLYVPAEQIWLPDIVLYNNADGNYEVTIMTKAVLHHDGTVVWKPPAIFRSACQIDITYFPFDRQECFMKFGTWTYDGSQVDLRHIHEVNDTPIVDIGMDLSDFYLSVEWDIMSVPAIRRIKYYSCCPEPYLDITFNITLRRKTLFYTVNLIIPVIGISSLSFLVFYLPSDSGEKVSLTISILLSLTFFLLVLIEIIPSTSLALPLIGIYITFCLVMITLSVLVTISVLNVHFRSPSTHRMAPWVKRLFIRTLPKILLMRPPQYKLDISDPKEMKDSTSDIPATEEVKVIPSHESPIDEGDGEQVLIPENGGVDSSSPDEPCVPYAEGFPEGNYPVEVNRSIKNAMFIAQHIDNLDEFESIREEWEYVAMVLDRLFLWIFTSTTIIGTLAIFLQAPSLYDTTRPIDILYSKVARSQFEALLTDEEELYAGLVNA